MQFLLRPMNFQAEGRGFDSGRVAGAAQIGLAAWPDGIIEENASCRNILR
jgi:hypothetical protein